MTGAAGAVALACGGAAVTFGGSGTGAAVTRGGSATGSANCLGSGVGPDAIDCSSDDIFGGELAAAASRRAGSIGRGPATAFGSASGAAAFGASALGAASSGGAFSPSAKTFGVAGGPSADFVDGVVGPTSAGCGKTGAGNVVIPWAEDGGVICAGAGGGATASTVCCFEAP